MALGQVLHNFEIVFGKGSVGFVPRKVLITLVADGDRLAKHDARCIGAIGHVPFGLPQGDGESACGWVDSALRQGVVALDKVISADAHSVFHGDDTHHILIPVGIFGQTGKHHFVLPFPSPEHNTVCCCAENRELVVALNTVGVSQPSFGKGVYHLIIYVEREHRPLVFHHFVIGSGLLFGV